MIRDTIEGEIASYYDPALWRELDHWLRAERVKQIQNIATWNHADFAAVRHQQGILVGLDRVRQAANEIMRNRQKED